MNPIFQVLTLLTYTLLLVTCIGQYDTTADLPSTMQTPSSPWNDGYMIPIAEIHNFHPESSVVTLAKPQIPCLCWWTSDSNGDDGYEPVAVAFTYAIVDESNTDILHESPLSDLAYRPFSYDTSYHEPWMNVATSNDQRVNAHIAYMMNLDQKTQWKRVAIKITNKNDIGLSTEIDWDVASQGNTISFIVTTWRFSSNTNVGNTVTYSPTPIPTQSPTHIPTQSPTQNPTQIPTQKPTSIKTPSQNPSLSPTENPSQNPTQSPTKNPTQTPSQHPTTQSPTRNPSKYPTSDPTADPTFAENAVSDEHETSSSTTLAADDRNVTGQSGFAAYYDNYVLWVLVLIINVMICCLLIAYIVWKRRKLKTKKKTILNVLADSGSGSGAASNMSGDIALAAMSVQNNVNMNVINPDPVAAAHVMGVMPFGIYDESDVVAMDPHVTRSVHMSSASVRDQQRSMYDTHGYRNEDIIENVNVYDMDTRGYDYKASESSNLPTLGYLPTAGDRHMYGAEERDKNNVDEIAIIGDITLDQCVDKGYDEPDIMDDVTLDEHSIHFATGNDGDYDSDDSSKLYMSHEQDDDLSYHVDTKGFQ